MISEELGEKMKIRYSVKKKLSQRQLATLRDPNLYKYPKSLTLYCCCSSRGFLAETRCYFFLLGSGSVELCVCVGCNGILKVERERNTTVDNGSYDLT